MSNDGTTKVVRTDTYGAYRLVGTTWKQLVTVASLPSEFHHTDFHAGVYEIAVAPNAPSRVYMFFSGYVLRSNNAGDTWSKTSFAPLSIDPNDPPRMWGEKMAVDPANPDVVYVGTPANGVWRTTDGGGSWARVTEIPAGTPSDSGAITGIAFDASSGTTGGRTNKVYVASHGNGVYQATGGTTFTSIAGPSAVEHAAMAADGTYYATSRHTSPSSVWRYRGGAWTNITPSLGGGRWWHTITVSPTDSNRVLIGDDSGDTVQTTNAGMNWSANVAQKTIASADIPWLEKAQDIAYMSSGRMLFDPVVADKVWFSEGVGVFTATITPSTTTNAWQSISKGIEQLVVTTIAVAPGGKPLIAAWDRPIWEITNPDVYPTSYLPSMRFHTGLAVSVSPIDSNFVVSNLSDVRGCCEGDGLALNSGYSLDKGKTWTRFPTMPMGSTSPWTWGFGTLAASSNTNIVWVASNRKPAYYTKDRGQSWQQVNLPGVDWSKAADLDGVHFAYYLNRHTVTADGLTPGTFYLLHSDKGLYRTTNGGDTWSLVYTGTIEPWTHYNAKLRAVPGAAGKLYLTPGPLGSVLAEPASGAFRKSTNGGVSWTAVPNVLEVNAFGFGKSAPGQTQPALFISGWVNGTYGIYRSDDDAQSWVSLGDFPLGSIDRVAAIEGDPDVFGKVYVGFTGSGAVYGGYGLP